MEAVIDFVPSLDEQPVDINALFRELNDGELGKSIEKRVRKEASGEDRQEIRKIRKRILNAECSLAGFNADEDDEHVQEARTTFLAILEQLIESAVPGADEFSDLNQAVDVIFESPIPKWNESESDVLVQEGRVAFNRWQRLKADATGARMEISERQIYTKPTVRYGFDIAPTVRGTVVHLAQSKQHKPSEESHKTRRAEAQVRRGQQKLLQLRIGGAGKVAEAFAAEIIDSGEFGQLMTELSKPPWELNHKYFCAKGSENLHFAMKREKTVKATKTDDGNKKNKNKKRGGRK